MVFIVEGHKNHHCKTSSARLRAGGEGWPLSLSRAGFEYNVLCQEAKYAGHTLIPQVYFTTRKWRCLPWVSDSSRDSA